MLLKRKIIRLKNYDYTQEGAYFVTICIDGHKCKFGSIENERMLLNELGKKVDHLWKELPNHNSNIILDEHIVMPNHLHGIIVITDNLSRGVQLNAPTKNNQYSMISPKKGSLSVIVRNFKAAFTTWCRCNDYPDFAWQRNYYDRVIRNDKELNAIREYIFYNPNKWEWDKLNPEK